MGAREATQGAAEGCAERTSAEIVNRVRARVCSVRSTNTVTGTIHDSVDTGKPLCDPRRRRCGRIDRQVQVTKDLLPRYDRSAVYSGHSDCPADHPE